MALGAARAAGPAFQVWDGERLAEVKAAVASGERPIFGQTALDQLRSDVVGALQAPLVSVLDKTKTGASREPRDYYSLAPYWWPDPAKPDGLPYIWRDGEANPTALVGTDSDPFKTMANRVEALALSWYLLNDAAAGARAADQLERWFTDPRTGMNPHLEYAQEIPGVRTGSGIGIIALRRLVLLLDAVRALRTHPAWTPERDASFMDWCRRYHGWLRDSKHGELADQQHNNHGTFYDFQLTHLARFIGAEDEARERLFQGAGMRLARHIFADGSQPYEQRRTRGLYYSIINLAGLALLAESAADLGLDWWQGPELPAAMAYLGSYLDSDREWPHGDIDRAPRSAIAPVLALAPAGMLDPELAAAVERIARESSERWVLTGVPPL